MKPLLIIFCVALSIGVKAQSRKHPDTIRFNHSRIFIGIINPLEVSVSMSSDKDSGIVITGDTVKAMRMMFKNYLDEQAKYLAAQRLLNFHNVLTTKSESYKKALRNYWKLNNDKRYKTLKP